MLVNVGSVDVLFFPMTLLLDSGFIPKSVPLLSDFIVSVQEELCEKSQTSNLNSVAHWCMLDTFELLVSSIILSASA